MFFLVTSRLLVITESGIEGSVLHCQEPNEICFKQPPPNDLEQQTPITSLIRKNHGTSLHFFATMHAEQEAVLKATAVRSPLPLMSSLLPCPPCLPQVRSRVRGVWWGRGCLGALGGWGGGGGWGHFIHLAMYCTTTWCFALKGLRTIRANEGSPKQFIETTYRSFLDFPGCVIYFPDNVRTQRS